jgi:hypothetical protein
MVPVTVWQPRGVGTNHESPVELMHEACYAILRKQHLISGRISENPALLVRILHSAQLQ